jgi:PAS domain S-box-containing protein
MDWCSLAALLAERGDRPMALLDRRGVIRLLNAAMEQTLGRSRDEVAGRLWREACALPQTARTSSHGLSQALSGAIQRCQCEAVTGDGRRLRLKLEISLIGRGRDLGLLLTVMEATLVDGGLEYIANQDTDYEITVQASDFGHIRKLAQMGTVARSTGAPARACFELLHQRQSPCEDCPVLRAGHESWPRMTIRRRARAVDGFEIVSAHPVDTTTVSLSVRFIADSTLRAVYEARLAGIADDAQLSPRERAVLNYLLVGRSLDDIATILGLSRHTVKFHQTNIVRKLGADSRLDIMRLTGF